MIEDHRAILGSLVGALAVERRGVVNLEQHAQDVAVRDHGRIERDLDDLGVARGQQRNVRGWVLRKRAGTKIAAAAQRALDTSGPGEDPSATDGSDGR